MSGALEDRLIGAKIVHVEPHADPGKGLVLVFEHRGTDDDSGYLIVPLSSIFFADGGDPDAWRSVPFPAQPGSEDKT